MAPAADTLDWTPVLVNEVTGQALDPLDPFKRRTGPFEHEDHHRGSIRYFLYNRRCKAF